MKVTKYQKNISMENKPSLLILGKLPPPYFGPAIATKIILNSSLKDFFHLIHFDTRLNSEIKGIGKLTLRKLLEIPAQYLKYLKVILKKSPDLVLIPISQSTAGFIKDSVYILIAALFRKKVIIHLRGSNIKNWLNSSGKLVNYYFKLCMHCVKGVIVLGNKLKYLFENYFPPDNIFVVPNGGNFTFPIIEKKNNKFKVLYLSNFLPSKGFQDILEAFELLTMKNINLIELEAVGSFSNFEIESTYKKIVLESKLPVIFQIPVDENLKYRILAKSEIFVFTPREPEGHPWVIIEAMAAGLPIITTDQGAITESVIDGVNGFIVEPKNPKQIAEKIELLIKNEELRKMMGRESRRLYEENLTEEKMVERLRQVFETVLNDM